MRALTFVVSVSIALVVAAGAQAGGSCSTFAKITGFDEATMSVKIKRENGREVTFFPKTEGAPATSKIPKKCSGRVFRQKSFPVQPTGGRMTITQVRANFSGKMLNDADDETWLPKKLKELIASKETVVVVMRQPPGSDRDDEFGVTTIYLPITDEELKEIERLNAQAEDV